MPFIASLNGKRVIPEEVDDGTEVTCLGCSEKMYPRGPSSDGRARHFYHANSAGYQSCSNHGESDTHRKMKSLAVSWLKNQFSEEKIKRCGPEIRVDIRDKGQSTFDQFKRSTTHRRADALIEFQQAKQNLLRGVVLEVQYRNEGKDLISITDDYLDVGFSVLWLDEDDFEENRCILHGADLRHRVITHYTREYGYNYPPTLEDEGSKSARLKKY